MSLKIVHTSDWHLGKKLYKACRLKEQAQFLNWLNQYLVSANAEALIIAGDIFDTPHPSSKALKLYFDFLRDVPCPVYLISGNHDSGKFLEAPKTFLEEKNIHIVGEIPQDSSDIENINFQLNKDNISVNFTLLPYFRTYEILNLANELLSNEEMSTLNSEEAILKTLSILLEKSSKQDSKFFNILVAHHLFGSFDMAGSEQGLTLSGIESLPADILVDKYNYTALGHIHKKQELKKSNPMMAYCGSPLPFRFSEKNNKKLILIEIEESNIFSARDIAIPIFKPLYQIDCKLSEFDKKLISLKKSISEDEECYLELKIHLDSPQTGLIDDIKSKIPSKWDLISFYTKLNNIKKQKNEHSKIDFEDTLSLFNSYYKKKFPESSDIPKDLEIDFKNLLNESRAKLRESRK
jgi:exonuclease SbcD